MATLGTMDCYFGATWRLESYEKMSFTLSLTFMAEDLGFSMAAGPQVTIKVMGSACRRVTAAPRGQY